MHDVLVAVIARVWRPDGIREGSPDIGDDNSANIHPTPRIHDYRKFNISVVNRYQTACPDAQINLNATSTFDSRVMHSFTIILYRHVQCVRLD